MKLKVLTTLNRPPSQGGGPMVKMHEDTLAYRTTPEGELDILEEETDVVVTTYAAGQWVSISREKEEGEEWPEYVLDDKEEEESFESGVSLENLARQIPRPMLREPISYRGRGG